MNAFPERTAVQRTVAVSRSRARGHGHDYDVCIKLGSTSVQNSSEIRSPFTACEIEIGVHREIHFVREARKMLNLKNWYSGNLRREADRWARDSMKRPQAVPPEASSSLTYDSGAPLRRVRGRH